MDNKDESVEKLLRLIEKLKEKIIYQGKVIEEFQTITTDTERLDWLEEMNSKYPWHIDFKPTIREFIDKQIENEKL